MRIVPTPTDGYPNTTIRVALGGSTYTLRWTWNERDSIWYFGLDSPSGDPVLRGVRVVLNLDLLRTAPMSDDRPPYGLWVIRPDGGTEEPTLETLGKACRVLYPEPDDA